MFHAGAVVPWSAFLLQLLTFPGGDVVILLEVLEEFDPPVISGLSFLSAGGRESGLNVVEAPVLLVVLGGLFRLKAGDASGRPLEKPPSLGFAGLKGPPPRLGPIVVGKLEALMWLATRLNALKHCRTCAGSFASNKSTVRKRSWEGMLKGGISQARRNCEMFSICMKGICDFLNLTPGLGTARFISLD
jgi:hypothetical protein